MQNFNLFGLFFLSTQLFKAMSALIIIKKIEKIICHSVKFCETRNKILRNWENFKKSK